MQFSSVLIVLLLPLLSIGRRQTVDEITRKQLDELREKEDYLAVYWYGKNCKTCDRVLSILETHREDLDEAGVEVVKLNDRKSAKQVGVLNFPGITFFKAGVGANYEGDLSNPESLLNFLSSPEALDLPDHIEEVGGKQLETLIEEKTFVAAFFYNPQPESTNALESLEKIDANADKLGISMVKINDLELVDEYGLSSLPALVYYRHSAPVVFEGEIAGREEAVLQWLVQNRATGEESEDVIEDVTKETLETMISSVENLAVLFYDGESRKADLLLESLENIDDDCDIRGISFVKVNDPSAGKSFGITQLPKLVFFHAEVPNIFDGDLHEESDALDWIVSNASSDHIEDVTGSMLERLVSETRALAVLFCKYLAYAVIALTHTCYLLRNYNPPDSKNNVVTQQANNNPLTSVAAKQQFMPVERVRGLANES